MYHSTKKFPRSQNHISKNVFHTHKTKPESTTVSKSRSYRFFLKGTMVHISSDESST